MNDQVSKDLELYKLSILQDDMNNKEYIEQKYNLSKLPSEVVIYALEQHMKGKCQLDAVVDYVFNGLDDVPGKAIEIFRTSLDFYQENCL